MLIQLGPQFAVFVAWLEGGVQIPSQTHLDRVRPLIGDQTLEHPRFTAERRGAHVLRRAGYRRHRVLEPEFKPPPEQRRGTAVGVLHLQRPSAVGGSTDQAIAFSGIHLLTADDDRAGTASPAPVGKLNDAPVRREQPQSQRAIALTRERHADGHAEHVRGGVARDGVVDTRRELEGNDRASLRGQDERSAFVGRRRLRRLPSELDRGLDGLPRAVGRHERDRRDAKRCMTRDTSRVRRLRDQEPRIVEHDLLDRSRDERVECRLLLRTRLRGRDGVAAEAAATGWRRHQSVQVRGTRPTRRGTPSISISSSGAPAAAGRTRTSGCVTPMVSTTASMVASTRSRIVSRSPAGAAVRIAITAPRAVSEQLEP